MSQKVVVAPSEIHANVFFIFRENGIEVKIDISGGFISSDGWLRSYEKEYIEKKLIGKKWQK